MSKLAYEEEGIGLLDAADGDNLTEKPSPKLDRLKPSISARQTLLTGLDFLGKCLVFLLPSFITSTYHNIRHGNDKPAPSLRPTAYLDGVRGLAAWAVFNGHLGGTLTKGYGAGYGHWSVGRWELYKLPIIRLIDEGLFSVALFFVISGFVLSISIVEEQSSTPRHPGRAMRRLASSIFKRPFRLLGPSYASMFIVFVLLRTGYIGHFQARNAEYSTLIHGWNGIVTVFPTKQPTLLGQLRELAANMLTLVQLFTVTVYPDPRYNGPLWTIKMEFRASLLLFLFHAALYHVRKPVRRPLVALLIVLAFVTKSPEVPPFLAGYLIADFARSAPTRPRRTLVVSSWVLFVAGSFVGSVPWEADKTPWATWAVPLNVFGYSTPNTFWNIIGATMIVYGIGNIPSLKKLYTLGPVQYLGKISFALYLTHFWLVHTLGLCIYYNVWRVTGRDTMLGEVGGFFIGYVAILAICVWVADLFWRCVDVPTVKLTARLEKWMFS